MHSHTSICPNASCPSHTCPRAGAQAPHGAFKTRRGRARRTICTFCGRTRSARAGTPYHRMRRPAKDLDLALSMSTEGMSVTSIARALRAHPTTVRRWIEKSARHVARFSEQNLVVDEPEELQIDELRVAGIGQAEGTWAWSAIEVSSRVWLATKVSRRTLRSTRQFLAEVRRSCGKMIFPTPVRHGRVQVLRAGVLLAPIPSSWLGGARSVGGAGSPAEGLDLLQAGWTSLAELRVDQIPRAATAALQRRRDQLAVRLAQARPDRRPRHRAALEVGGHRTGLL